jgi:hypothetical protein
MTIGKKFLERVLGESRLEEAKKPRNLDSDTFDKTLQDLGSAADTYLPIDKKTRLMKMYNGGADIKAVSTSTRNAKEWVQKTRTKYEAMGWKFFHYENNVDSHEILFTKSVVKEEQLAEGKDEDYAKWTKGYEYGKDCRKKNKECSEDELKKMDPAMKKGYEKAMNEGVEELAEATKDVDGFKDNFDITTLSASSPVMANLMMPMARQVVQLYHLMGVSVETLEMRPKAVKSAAMEVADEMRTNRSLRLAAQRLFTTLATSKGFARKEEEVMEAAPEKDMQLIGNTIVKQMEAVLAALKLPAGVLARAMRRDQQTMMETADILRSGAGRSRFSMLASELGVDLTAMQQSVKVQEGVDNAFTPSQKKLIAAIEQNAGKKIAQMSRVELKKVTTAMVKDMSAAETDDLLEILQKVAPGMRAKENMKTEAVTMDGPQLGANRAAQAMETLIGALGLQNVFNSREAMAVRRELPARMSALRNPTAVFTLIDRLVKELANTK